MKKSTKIYILEDFYYEQLNEDNIDESVDLIVDTQLFSPGNPLFVQTQISVEDLKEYYQEMFQKKIRRKELNLIFYYKNKASGYSLYDKYQDDQDNVLFSMTKNENFNQKLKSDQLLVQKAQSKISNKKEFYSNIFGVNSKRGFNGQEKLQFQEGTIISYLMGGNLGGGYCYNKKMKEILLKRGLKQLAQLEKNELQDLGIYDFVNKNNENLIFIFIEINLQEYTLQYYFKRFEEIKNVLLSHPEYKKYFIKDRIQINSKL